LDLYHVHFSQTLKAKIFLFLRFVYYINAKQQKKKEEIHIFYAFPQIFYKKFIF